MPLSVRILLVLLLCSLVFADLPSNSRQTKRKHGHDGGGDEGDDNDDNNAGGTSSTPVTSSSPVNGTAGPGDTKCMTVGSLLSTLHGFTTYAKHVRG